MHHLILSIQKQNNKLGWIGCQEFPLGVVASGNFQIEKEQWSTGEKYPEECENTKGIELEVRLTMPDHNNLVSLGPILQGGWI